MLYTVATVTHPRVSSHLLCVYQAVSVSSRA